MIKRKIFSSHSHRVVPLQHIGNTIDFLLHTLETWNYAFFLSRFSCSESTAMSGRSRTINAVQL